MKLRWRKEVYAELEAAASFYRDRNRAAMKRLLDEFENVLQRIRRNPEMGESRGGLVRRRRVFGFPFDVI